MADPMLELYYFPGSFYSQKALIALEEKGVPYKTHLVMLAQKEVWAPWYLRINPKGAVPCLLHGDVKVTDSQDIIHYLEEKYPDPVLIPPESKPEYRQKVIHCQKLLDTLLIEVITYGSFPHRHLTKNSTIPAILAKRLDATPKTDKFISMLEGYSRDNPDLKELYEIKLNQVRYGTFGKPITEEALKEELDAATKIFREMETLLEGNKQAGYADYWLCGPDFTEADIILSVTLYRLAMVGFAYLWQDGTMPNIEKYYPRAMQRKSVNKITSASMSTHTKMTAMFGHKAWLVETAALITVAGLILAAGFGIWYNVTKQG